MTVNRSSKPSVARSAGTVGAFTLLSRFGGLFRDAVFANLFGASTASDAYLMAFTIPNTFRTLVAEGSLTVAFLPVFREAETEQGPEAGVRLLSEAIVIFPGLAAAIAGLAVVLAEPIVGLFAPGFRSVPGKFELTVDLTRIMFAYLPLVSFVALTMGALNARRHFATSAAAPIAFNLTMIAVLLTLGVLAPGESSIYFVAWAVVAGGGAQVLLQLWGLRRAGITTWPKPRLSPEIRRILWLMAPAIGSLAVYQLNILIVRYVASGLAEGSVTALFYADRFFQLPLGVFGIAIATASLPALSDAHLEGGSRALSRTLLRSLELNAFIAIPATAGLMALALPITSTVLQHGAFTHEQARNTASVLELLAPGLLAVASIRVVSQAFFSIQDTRTPVACSAVGVATNLALASFLATELGARGLALSLTLSAWTQLLVQLVFLRRRLRQNDPDFTQDSKPGVRVVVQALKAMLMSAPMAGSAWGASLLGDWSSGLTVTNALVLVFAVALGTFAYGGLQLAGGSDDARRLAGAVGRRLVRSK